jgi:PAS domain S-box-containing protein
MDAVITMDGGRRIVVFNEAAEKMFRCKAESALGARLERFIPERFRAAHDAHVARFGETRVTARMMGGRLDLYGLRADGEEFPIDASISQVTVDGEKFYTVILRDITERKRAEEAVRASAIRFRTLFDTMSEGFAINEIICDEAGRPCDLRFLEVNQAFERHTGLAAAAVLGRTVRELFPGAEQEWFDRYGKVALTGEPAHFEAQFGPLGKWFEVSAYRTEPGRFAVVFYDVSERKAGAAALERSYRQLRERSAAMNEVREAERTRIARELHDELAQWLTAIKMDVTWLASRLPRGEEPLARRTEKMRHLVDSTVAAVRRIASDLRPVMLDDLGLVPSIEHLLHTFSERANVAISFDASADGMEFLEPLTTSVYRMVQEALTNVARHAAATAVDVALGVEEDALAVRVRDNGRGLGSAPEGYKSYGLLGIKERAHTLGGNAEIYSPPEGGTVVDIRIPIEGYRKSGGAT